LESRAHPYYGFLSVWPVEQSGHPARWGTLLFDSPTCRRLYERSERRGRLHVVDAEYKEVVAGSVFHIRCRLVQRGRWLAVLSLISEADVFSQARPEFDRLANNLHVGPPLPPSRIALAALAVLGMAGLSWGVSWICRRRRTRSRRPEEGEFDDYG
jgi:hypothetical protein